MEIIYFTLLSTTFLFFLSEFSLGTDTISQRESITDGKTLISKDESFELGFFSPGTSTNRYVGIWYKWDRTTVVWVANRQNPIKDLSGLLMINGTGHLILFSQNNSVVWSANQTEVVHSPLLQLLDSGNLVLRDKNDENAENCVWQSFDYPSDTLLPGMKLGWDLKHGLNRRISAWKSSDDPSPGDFIWGIELHNYPEAVMWKGSAVYFRSGEWNGLQFSGGPDLKPNPLFEYEFISNENEVYYVYHLKNKSVMSRIVLNQTTYMRQRYAWNVVTRTWGVYASVPRDNCDQFGLCGAYGNCIIGDSPICQCLKGFQPKSPGNLLDWSGGCVRNKPLNCQNKDASGFSKVGGLKLPDSTYSWLNEGLNIKECRAKCLNNCSCTAYTNSDIREGGSGCVMWFGDLIDMRQFPSGGQEIYIRMHVSELGAKYKRKVKVAVMVLTLLFGVAGMMLLLNYIRKLRTTAKDNGKENRIINQNNETQTQNLELFFDLATIANATSNFSAGNKLGEGGFGPVYSGTLEDGKEIAVKRLSKDSGQGQEEFKNEVILIANLQHRNLVKLLGSCIQRDERLLIYEYMPNKSLDCFIFDHTRAKQLDWSKRFNIISGIARGLLYLHQDSRLRIIHRDLKASNVLLDYEMNPKISDFGVARSIRGDQGEANTNRIIGTYGYMAPEYAISGKFSIKSDVFSFGILLLEIISGKKNKGFYHLYPSDLNLIGHAWRLWKEGRALELIDPNLDVSGKLSEALRSIHVGLLCVQERPIERPSMSDVVVMLASASASALPQPKQPGFSLGKNDTFGSDDLSTNQDFYSTNEITLTLLEAR